MNTRILKIDDPATNQAAVQEAADCLSNGGLVVFPTETVYGVGASIASSDALRRLREVKQRPDTKPFGAHLPGQEAARRLVGAGSTMLNRAVKKLLPGPATILATIPDAEATQVVADMGLPPESKALLYHEGTIGLRCPDHPVAQAVLGAVDSPVVASSANQAGGRDPFTAEQAIEALDGQVDIAIDAGPSQYAKPSTIIRIQGDGVEVIREGVYDKRTVDSMLECVLLFVCTGNTCRSPMAQAVARHELAHRLGPMAADAEAGYFRAVSAGVFASPGSPATPEGVRALEAMNIPTSPHHSQMLSMDLLQQAEAVYCMTESHRRAVLGVVPGIEYKVFRLDADRDIADPIGGGLEVYKVCLNQIQTAIARRFDELGIV